MTVFKGSCPALITPFNENGVNFDTLQKLLEFQLKNKSDAILVCGTTGEPSTMTTEEINAVIDFTVKFVNKRVPVIVGTGANCTKTAIEKSINAYSMGADAILVVTPYYNKATQKGCIEHFSAIADSCPLPLIMYNVPSRTGVNILPATASILANHKNIVAIKEASGNMEQVVELRRLTEGRLDIYSGDDGINLPIMSMGGIGAISVVANVNPLLVHEMTQDALNNNYASALTKQLAIKELANVLFSEVNPIPAKTACNLMGFKCGNLRLPLTEMEDANKEKLVEVLKKYNLI